MVKNCRRGPWTSSRIQPCDSDESISCFTTSFSTDSKFDRSTNIASRSDKNTHVNTQSVSPQASGKTRRHNVAKYSRNTHINAILVTTGKNIADRSSETYNWQMGYSKFGTIRSNSTSLLHIFHVDACTQTHSHYVMQFPNDFNYWYTKYWPQFTVTEKNLFINSQFIQPCFKTVNCTTRDNCCWETIIAVFKAF